jgi:putative aminopeptidase FrvX
VFVAIEVARRVKEEGGGAGPVAGVAAVQEEIGAHGARVMAYGLEPDLAVRPTRPGWKPASWASTASVAGP